MPGRHFSAGGYRYGFNGMEKDDEIKADGNSLDFGSRIYDSRLGGWLSVDPLTMKFHFVSPYVFTNNNPILFIDKDGNEWVNPYTGMIVKTQAALVNNPDNKKLKKQLEFQQKRETAVNELLEELKTNDAALYNYIDKLQIDIGGDNIKNIKVDVYLDDRAHGNMKQVAETEYSLSGDQITPNAKYNGKDIVAPKAPYSKTFGFDITIYNTVQKDISLANEAGDVMYYMEYNSDAVTQRGDNTIDFRDRDKALNEYMRDGGPGRYSYDVQSKYSSRKTSGEGKDINNNPYPLPNVSKKDEKK